jgi:hypothetical protein
MAAIHATAHEALPHNPNGNASDEFAPVPRGRGAASKVEKFGWTVRDEVGTFRMIHKASLKIDHAYQREKVSETRVLNIAREWSWLACGALIVVERRPEDYWVADGQHRKLGADKRADIQSLPCLVFRVEGVAGEAEGFHVINSNRSNPGAFERFKALCVARDQAALAVRDMVTAYGYQIAKGSQPHTVSCVASLLGAYRASPDDARIAWGLAAEVSAGEHVHDRLFDGLFYLERRLRRDHADSLSENHNRAGLLAAGRDLLIDRMNAAGVYLKRGGARVWAEGIVNALNKRRKGRRLPSVFEAERSVEERG